MVQENMRVRKQYLDAIDHWKQRETQAMEQKLREDRDDEAVFHRIAINVLDIFEKMFLVSYGAVFMDRANPKLAPVLSNYDEPMEQLKAACELYFHEIPQPWQTRADEEEKRGNTEEWKKELVKLEVVRLLEAIFQRIYSDPEGVIGNDKLHKHDHNGHKH